MDAEEPPDLNALARDWITLWQSELSAAAADREVTEAWHALAALWAGAATAMISAMPHERTPRPAQGAPAAGPAPDSAASVAVLAALERLGQRLNGIERRLAALEGSGDGRTRGRSSRKAKPEPKPG